MARRSKRWDRPALYSLTVAVMYRRGRDRCRDYSASTVRVGLGLDVWVASRVNLR